MAKHQRRGSSSKSPSFQPTDIHKRILMSRTTLWNSEVTTDQQLKPCYLIRSIFKTANGNWNEVRNLWNDVSDWRIHHVSYRWHSRTSSEIRSINSWIIDSSNRIINRAWLQLQFEGLPKRAPAPITVLSLIAFLIKLLPAKIIHSPTSWVAPTNEQ